MNPDPAPRRSARGQRPVPKNPDNVADPVLPEPVSEFASQQRSESAKKGWETRRDHKEGPGMKQRAQADAGALQASVRSVSACSSSCDALTWPSCRWGAQQGALRSNIQ